MNDSIEQKVMSTILNANPSTPIGFATASTLPMEKVSVEEIVKMHEEFKQIQKQAEQEEGYLRAWLRRYISQSQTSLRDLAEHLQCTERYLFEVLYNNVRFPLWLIESMRTYFTSIQEDKNNGS